MNFKRLAAISACGAILAALTDPAAADAFVEPPVFASANGVLDLLMIAKARPIPALSLTPPGGGAPVHPTGWIYEICQRAKAIGNQCPADSSTVAEYGGVRLALQKGDVLKIRLVNQLPKLDPSKVTHAADPGEANLPLNLTNLHTHGLIVEARAPTLANPTFGDDVFVQVYNSANGTPIPQTTHQHGSIVKDYVDYQIAIPANHPSGAFWFHPHVHGLSLNQISSGMAGIISIGQAGDYAAGDAVASGFPGTQVRHLILKDMQVLAAGQIGFDNGPADVAEGEVLNQEDPDFCAQYPASASEQRQGSCPGLDGSDDGGNNYVGGRWFFTVSGQVFPTLRVTNPDGELWRLTNASGSVSYDLQLTDDWTQRPMVMQLVSVDGVSIDVPPATALGTVVQLGGGRFKLAECPQRLPVALRSAFICVSEFTMMPSSRVELWVTYRDPKLRPASSPTGASATLKTIGITTGPAGDSWPAIDLAKVQFAQAKPRALTNLGLSILGDALAANQTGGIFSAPVPYAKAAPLPLLCKPLASGHRRRIFFGLVDYNDSDSFGLGYEEVDEHGAVIPGTQVPVSAFDPSRNAVCLPLGPGQTPVHETWELVNLATENHNFHIHQTKFRLVQPSAASGSLLAPKLNPAIGAGVMEDNVPLPVASPNIQDVANSQNGYCTIEQWRGGQCSSTPVVVDIPFSQLGEFVYHCHILEHEDGGMMAKIQVVPSPY
ncbi:multicopper oxidase domain-containing protein [Methylocapsa acidiphila]|uniref:multicopper oxidase domain-containing protein n=1 Tax=Methylocapsa acidiphila TaxID=133552 RepID=UPI0004188AD9|nr:multicopper oxidase domain-containing protein [Methylocapsa acidiphila]